MNQEPGMTKAERALLIEVGRRMLVHQEQLLLQAERNNSSGAKLREMFDDTYALRSTIEKVVIEDQDRQADLEGTA